MLMVAILICCAYPTVARPRASAQNPNTCLVTMELLTFAVLFILSDIGRPPPQNVRPMEKRNVDRFSKNGMGLPYVKIALLNVAVLGNRERSDTMGGCRNSRTLVGL